FIGPLRVIVRFVFAIGLGFRFRAGFRVRFRFVGRGVRVGVSFRVGFRRFFGGAFLGRTERRRVRFNGFDNALVERWRGRALLGLRRHFRLRWFNRHLLLLLRNRSP